MSLFFGILMAAGLLVAAGLFAWRQVQTLRRLKTGEQMLPEDRTYTRRQCYRRFVGCGLMVVLAVLVMGLFYFEVLSKLEHLSDAGEAAKAQGQEPQLGDEDRGFLNFALGYVNVIGLVLLGLFTIAFFDVLAIRRYGMRHRKRIFEDRKAMLARQLPLLRKDRNGSQ